MNTSIDVVIPYNETDRHLVHEALVSILEQENCTPIIHMVADNCEQLFLSTPEPINSIPTPILPTHQEVAANSTIIHYSTPGIGPYHIVNKLVPSFQTNYIAIQDADDISYPTRLSHQLNILQDYVMTSGTMRQRAIEGYDGTRHIMEPLLYSGEKLVAAPMGRFVNSVRAMRKDFFIDQNGFADYPCSGDFQFDNRCLFQKPQPKMFFDPTILGVRRLRPNSLSNGGTYKFDTDGRNRIAWRIMLAIQTMRAHPTLAQSRELGYLDKDIGSDQPPN